MLKKAGCLGFHNTHIQFPDSLSVIEFLKETVQGEMAKLSDKSSPGPDGFSSLLLKRCASAIAEPLSFIMQCSFQSSIWRHALTTPIYKKGDKTVVANYRPISLTCICVKIMECIIREQLLQFLNRHSVIPINQHGFLPKNR